MARKTKDDKAKAASAKGRSASGGKGAKVKRTKPVKKAMVIKEKAVKSRKPSKTPTAQKSPTDSASKTKHGRRYLEAKAKINPDKLYPPAEAVSLVKQTCLARFDAKIDLHLNIKDPKFKKEITLPHPLDAKNAKTILKSEKKTPLLHTTIGKKSDKDEALVDNLKAVLAAFGHGMILKAVVCSTMGPGIKVQID